MFKIAFKKNKKKKLLSFPRLLAWVFVIIAGFQMLNLVMAVNSPEVAFAAGTAGGSYEFQVPLPSYPVAQFNNSTQPIAEYVKAIYQYAVGAVGILAAIMLMIGGLRWIMAGGNASSIGEARDTIFAALSGLVLVTTSYLILSQVNPALVELGQNVVEIKVLEGEAETEKAAPKSSYCMWMSGVDNKKPDCPPPADTFKDYKTKASSDTLCGKNSLPAESSSCCCKPLPEGCTSYTIACEPCNNCSALTGFKCKNHESGTGETIDCPASYKLSGGLVSKLNVLKTNTGGGASWRITEPWPPTYSHKSGCHANGGCFDINLSGSQTDATSVTTLKSQLEAAGFSTFKYECVQSAGCCESIYNLPANRCMYNADASANHFHIDN